MVIKLSVYYKDWSLKFDHAEALARLHEHFPDVVQLPGDQLAEEVRRAVELGAADVVVRSLREKASRLGPCYGFNLSVPSGVRIMGHVRKYDITFSTKASLSEEDQKPILEYLRSFGRGEPEVFDSRAAGDS